MLLTILSTLLSFQPAQASPAFCVQHFNMYGPLYAADVYGRTQRATRELHDETPLCDVLQLIEVWNAPQIAQVEQALGDEYQISAPNEDSRIGLMSLVRGQIEATETHDYLVNNEDGILDGIRSVSGVKKAFHVAQIKLPAVDEELTFISTHLHPTSQVVRIAQIFELYQWRLQHPDRKIVLSGDFNAEKDSLERELILDLVASHDSFEELLGGYPPDICSYCEENPRSWLWGHHLFDYIFYSNRSQTATSLQPAGGFINLKGENGNTLSDHYGLRMYLSVEPGVREDLPGQKDAHLEARRVAALAHVQASIDLLIQSGMKIVQPTVQALQRLSAELAAQQGPQWNFFTQER